jgi:hypothetical protein
MVMGRNRWRYAQLMGQKITAQMAHEWGAVNEVLPKGELMDRAWAIARYLLRFSPMVLRHTRRTFVQEFKRAAVNDLGFGQTMELLGMTQFTVRSRYKRPISREWTEFALSDVPAPAPERRLLYGGEIRQNDHHFGRFLEQLERMGLREDTVIIFVSDHGEHLGERQWWRHHPPAFIQVVRIPLIVSYPRGLTRPRTVRHPVQLMDVMPTVLELAGIDARALPMQGDSLVPLMHGQDGAYWAERVTLAEEVTRYKGVDDPNVWSSVFFQGWHFLQSELVPDMQVFNYERDPQERQGRVPGFWDHLLRRAVLDLMAAVKNGDLAIWKAMTRGESRAIRHSPEVHDRLRQLGYVE